MGRIKKPVETVESEETVETPIETTLVTFSSEDAYARFGVMENQAEVSETELKEGEKFVVINGKTFIEYSKNGATYLL